jgi:Na+/proline symporter
MYDLLVSASSWSPVSGNQDGSYLTMKSNAGILFGGCTIASGFSGVFCDQGYWQRAIASRPKSTTKAYMLGGLSWFAIPWGESAFRILYPPLRIHYTPLSLSITHPSSVTRHP